jgi:glycosyltransferase involved in cell wall biosynthesis
MMHLFINSLAASAGGGLTYIRNVLPYFAAQPDLRLTVALNSGLRKEFESFPNVDFREVNVSVARRFWFEQSSLPGMIRDCKADVLLSAGNFAIRKSPVPQILLSRNSIYLSADFYRDLITRREYREWMDTRLRSVFAKKSIRWADVTVAPSEAFAEELRAWTGAKVISIHHGFDRDAFVRNSEPLFSAVEHALASAPESLKLLFVSHYNYYRNFETLIRSLPLLRERLAPRPVQLFLTCHLAEGKNPGAYRTGSVADLVRELGVSDMVLELGAIPYHQVHLVYARSDVYVTPAYTETFAHPLVEAMSSGVPVVASDLAVHREICAEAAVYFPKFDPRLLADVLVNLASSPETARRMAADGVKRSLQFSWKGHGDEILKVCRGLLGA